MPWLIHLEIETTREHLKHIEQYLEQWLDLLEESQRAAQRIEWCWDAPLARHRADALRSNVRALISLIEEMVVWHKKALSEYNEWLAMDEREWGYFSNSILLNGIESVIDFLSNTKTAKDFLDLANDLRNLDKFLYSTSYLLSAVHLQLGEAFTFTATQIIEMKHLKGPMVLLSERVDDVLPSQIDILLTFGMEFVKEIPENWEEGYELVLVIESEDIGVDTFVSHRHQFHH